MRLINRSCSALHTWNVGEYIRQAQTNIMHQDSNRFLTMQNIFSKLYLANLRDHARLQQ